MTAPESASGGDVEALAEARATNDRLNRRVQIAEAAVHELTTGTGNGKARPVAAEMWARCQETHERHCPRAERAEAALADLRARDAPLARECQGLVTSYTRAPGENGDRVADLLSEDTHRIGTAILALLGEEIEALLPEEDTTDG